MNKFGFGVAMVAVLVGLMAVTSVSGSSLSKRHHGEEFEHEGGELERPRHHHQKPEPEEHEHHVQRHPEPVRVHKSPVRGRREHPHKHPHGPGPKEHRPPVPKRHPSPNVGHPPRHQRKHNVCENPEPSHEGGEEHEPVEHEPEGFHGGRGGREGGHESEGGEEEARHGSFKGAGVFGGFKKEKEFDAGVRGSNKHSNRNTLNNQKTVVAGEQKAVNGGASSGDFTNVEGTHNHKNLNNDRLVVKESQRGTEDSDAFRGQSGHNEEGHFGASDTKVFGAQDSEAATSDQESDKEFEAGVHKKSSLGAVGGAGVVGGRF